jgi:hypothetical protein
VLEVVVFPLLGLLLVLLEVGDGHRLVFLYLDVYVHLLEFVYGVLIRQVVALSLLLLVSLLPFLSLSLNGPPQVFGVVVLLGLSISLFVIGVLLLFVWFVVMVSVL